MHMTKVRFAAVATLLALAACSREPAKPSSPPPPTAPATPIVAALTAPTPPIRPAAADAIDAAVAAAQAFSAGAQAQVAAVGGIEKQVRDLAAKAVSLAAKAGAGADRAALSAQVGKARTDAEAAYAGLSGGLATFQAQATAQTAAVQAAVDQCTKTPELAGYEGCLTLATEQANLLKAVDAVTKRYAAADQAYRAQRGKLEEAAASVALNF